MKTGIDTDGVLDRCSCGERAGFYLTREGWVAACSELCGEQTPVFGCIHEAMVSWNKARRAERRDLRRTHLRAKWDLGMWIICASNCAIWTLVVCIFIQWLRLKGEA